mmetsp:Transcript_34477/g.91008  ORF Transcript_34477/g.91008 Transcript_34477/m.91008 type:complete len:230 (+) Transcript_34477:511-1200(+)
MLDPSDPGSSKGSQEKRQKPFEIVERDIVAGQGWEMVLEPSGPGSDIRNNCMQFPGPGASIRVQAQGLSRGERCVLASGFLSCSTVPRRVHLQRLVQLALLVGSALHVGPVEPGGGGAGALHPPLHVEPPHGQPLSVSAAAGVPGRRHVRAALVPPRGSQRRGVVPGVRRERLLRARGGDEPLRCHRRPALRRPEPALFWQLQRESLHHVSGGIWGRMGGICHAPPLWR